MNAFKHVSVGVASAILASVIAFALILATTPHAYAAKVVGGSSGLNLGGSGSVSNLGELIVLDGLFNNSYYYGGGRYGSRLGELVVLDNLFDGKLRTGSSSNISGLGELIILDNLFTGQSVVVDQQGRIIAAPQRNVSRLGELIILNNLFK